MGELFTSELIEKAKEAKSAAELITLAKENGTDITLEEAAIYFTKLNPPSGAIADEELENVAGGGCVSEAKRAVTAGERCDLWVCRRCGKPGSEHIFAMNGFFCQGYYLSSYSCSHCSHLNAESEIWTCNQPGSENSIFVWNPNV